jgi:hypothetical protein
MIHLWPSLGGCIIQTGGPAGAKGTINMWQCSALLPCHIIATISAHIHHRTHWTTVLYWTAVWRFNPLIWWWSDGL